MGGVTKVLLTIWFSICAVVSLVLVIQTALATALRKLVLHDQICLEEVIRWPAWIMALICVTSLIGFFTCLCGLWILKFVCNLLLNIGFIFLLVLFLWKMLAFGWVRKPVKTSFENVYQNNSSLDEEYKYWLRTALASPKEWDKVNECLTKLQFCDEAPGPEPKTFLEDDKSWKIEDYYEFYKEGCCVRPARCNNRITTVKSESGEDDCDKWGKAAKPPNWKCYDCDSCKAARIATYETRVGKVQIRITLFSIFIFVTSILIGCGGFD